MGVRWTQASEDEGGAHSALCASGEAGRRRDRTLGSGPISAPSSPCVLGTLAQPWFPHL